MPSCKGYEMGYSYCLNGGFGGLPRENFKILEAHVCDFNVLLDHWFYNHKE